MKAKELRLDQILGRQLLGPNHHPIGRIEEVRAQRHGKGASVEAVVIGMTGLLERLDLSARLVFGAKTRSRVARWDQIDFSNPKKPRLMVPIDQLAEV